MSEVISKDGIDISFNRSGKGEPIIARGWRVMQPIVWADAKIGAAAFGAVCCHHLRPPWARGKSGDASSYALEREIDLLRNDLLRRLILLQK